MEKVLCWGTGSAFEAWFLWLKRMVDEKEIEVLALINRQGDHQPLHGFPTIGKDEIGGFSYDRIIVTATSAPMIESILGDAEELGIDGGKLITITQYEAEYAQRSKAYYDSTISGLMSVLAEISAASDDEVSDYDWMLERVCRWAGYGTIQIPEEFAQFCNFVSTLRIKTAMEVGVYRGRTAYFLCALLSRKNPELKYILVDICDQLDEFERFQQILPALEKRIPSTSDDFRGAVYDFVFIDADHSYDGSMLDYKNVGQYAEKVTCFHDIYGHEYDGLNGGVVRTWEEVQTLTQEKEHKIFSTYPEKRMGIGCVVHDK